MDLDLVISGATVVDGTGAPPARVDVGVSAATIVAVGDLTGASAGRTLDATGLVVSPGFIDTHAHVEAALLDQGAVAAKLAQGVTTEILGQDGLSYAPLAAQRLREQADYLLPLNGRYRGQGATFLEFLDQYDRATAQNVSSLAPYGAIRIAVAGWTDRALDSEQLQHAADLAEACLNQGAVGVGLGLDYFPQSIATTAELLELGRVVAAHGSVLVAHTRSRALGIVEAVREMVEVGAATGARVHISHLRAAAALPVIDEALDRGVDVTFDVYPYAVASSMMLMHVPPWSLVGGPAALMDRLHDSRSRARIARHLSDRLDAVADEYVLSGFAKDTYASLAGASLAQAAGSLGGTVGDVLTAMLADNDLAVGYVGSTVSDDSVAACMRHPAGMVCSDAILVGQRPHPRGWGSFPRYLIACTRSPGGLSLEQAVHAMTGRPARRFDLAGRGVIRSGKAADLVVLDLNALADYATYDAPRQLAGGVEAVVVNGEIVWADAADTGNRPGRALRRHDLAGPRSSSPVRSPSNVTIVDNRYE
ncbi:N-acyl-D-amino-acid deacylase family protein [Jiangella asiatica]|uniref:D-aminoacylase n=1 Tax=Jiangella asiatica TaxID=2530372 RepID=A0A4R5DEH3_9ACTN|nr:amidohydrolase family protein [Jiangella asiatica]TDE12179.1 D-aminoacylase [Jiangella asiatica]